MRYFLAAIIPYFLGAISGSMLVSKFFNLEDVAKKGSGNRGTTNVFRNYGFVPALCTLIIDLLKGTFAAYIGYFIEPQYGGYIAGVSVVIAHIWPVFFGFKGGKGVATYEGVLLYHLPILGLIEIVIFIITNLTIKIVSIGSIILSLISIFYVWVFHLKNIPLIAMVMINCVLIIFAHRDNIKRISKGEEKNTELLKG